MSDRDSWATPEWLADALFEAMGRRSFTYDPCSNDRSHVHAVVKLDGSPGKDGLMARTYSNDDTFFVNPPYSRGQVAKWVDLYKYQKSVFLLRWDPSTKWFRELITWCDWVWFAKDRINFEPPPGVVASSNPFPHALFFTFGMGDLMTPYLANLGAFFKTA